MKITTERATINNLIKQVEPFTSRAGSSEVISFESVLFSVDKDGSLIVTAQSEDRAVEIVTDPDLITATDVGSVLIPVHDLKTVLGATGNNDEDEVVIETHGKKRLSINAGGARVEIGITPITDDLVLPSVPKITSNTPTVELLVEDFSKIYKTGGLARRQSPDYPSLCAVHLELKGDTLTATSTDKRATIYVSAPANSVSGEDFAVLIQPSAVNEVLALFGGNENLSLAVATIRNDGEAERRLAHFTNDDGSVHAVTIGPSYDVSAFPTVQLHELMNRLMGGKLSRLVINKESLISVFKSAEKVSSLTNKNKEILLSMSPKNAEVSISGDNTFVKEIPVQEWTGDNNTTIAIRWGDYNAVINSFPVDKDGDIRLVVIEDLKTSKIIAVSTYSDESEFDPMGDFDDLPKDYFCLIPVHDAN